MMYSIPPTHDKTAFEPGTAPTAEWVTGTMGAINHSLLSFGFKVQLGQRGFKYLYTHRAENLAAYPRSLSQGIAFPVLTEVRRVRVCDDPTVSETQSPQSQCVSQECVIRWHFS